MGQGGLRWDDVPNIKKPLNGEGGCDSVSAFGPFMEADASEKKTLGGKILKVQRECTAAYKS